MTTVAARPRFFVSQDRIVNGRISITGPDAVHISRVLRLKAGDGLTLLDGLGKSYEAVIRTSGRDGIVCAIKREIQAPAPPCVKVTLAQGIPKGDKMDMIIQKGTELGVSRVIPLVCGRTVVKLEGEKLIRRHDRWRRIALESAKQCRRPDIPVVSGPASLEQVLADMPGEAMALIPWEAEKNNTLKDILCKNAAKDEVYIFIGPEGGFTRKEVEQACARGAYPVTLGPRILRTETAGLAVLIMILYQWADLGGGIMWEKRE